MVGNNLAEKCLPLLIKIKSAVILSYSLAEPCRDITHCVINEQVHVLVEDYVIGALLPALFSGQRDVVDIGARLKVADGMTNFKRPVRAIVLEDDHRGRNR